MTTATVPVVTVEPEALAYAEQVGMRAALDHMLEATPRLVPGLRTIHVRLKQDWEYSQTNIVWTIRMDPTTKDVYLRAVRDWESEFVGVVPPPVGHIFYLDLLDDVA